MRAVVVVKNGVEILDVEIPTPKKMKFLLRFFRVVSIELT